jgi:hypothetical protein
MPRVSQRVTRIRKRATRWRPWTKVALALAVIVPVIGLVAVAVHVNAPVTLQARAAAAPSAAAPAGVPAAPAGWSTVFSDDFTGAAGSGVDSQWMYDTGAGSSFGTGEIETMTNSTSNVYLDGNGDLDITALDNNGSWTSGRVQTTSANVGAPAGNELEVTASIEQPSDGPASSSGSSPSAAATPEARLAMVLAAMHAVRAKAIREIRLNHVDLGNRRIVIGGRARPLDDLTREVLLEWLAHRAARWPSTANPHLLVNQHSANGTGPAGIGHLYKTVLRGKAATLERLRVDRQLQEALAVGPDPLHLASLFGLDPKTAIRYAENARQLLVTAAEEQDPARSRGDA